MSNETKPSSNAAKIARRTFLVSAGVVGGGVALGLALSPNRLKIYGDDVASGDEVILNTWVKLTPDNKLTVIIPHSEMGQGVGTGLAQMLAEEMEVDWDTVSIEQAPASNDYINSDLGRGYIVGEGAKIPSFVYPMLDFTFLQIAKGLVGQLTGGSTAIRLTGYHGMRRAGAAAREMLMRAAAKEWGVPMNSVRAEASTLYHDASNRSASFGSFAVAAAKFTPNLKPALKSPSSYKIVGTPKPRLDLPEKVTGEAQFGMDVIVPGMKYAAIAQAPVFGARAVAVDGPANPAQQIVNLGDAVVAVADSYWTASNAVRQLDITWDGGDQALTSEDLRASHNKHLQETRHEEVMDKEGDAPKALQSPDAVSVEYAVPYLAHATMEPMNCTASVHDGKCELWVGHQNPITARDDAAKALGLKKSDVTVHNAYLGGGFGRRARTDNVVQAARVAAEIGAPVKLVWSREQDMANDFYRPAIVSRMRGLVDDGKISAMSHAYIYSDAGMPDSERPFAFQYDVPNKRIARHPYPSPIPVGSWRSVDFTQMGFFNESFIDELAHKAGADALAFRLAHKSDARHRAVLERLADEANWGNPKTPGASQGVAIVDSFETIVGQVAEVTVEGDDRIRLHRLTSVVDCGQVINPNAAEAQIHSSVIFALSAVFFGEITLENGEVVQQNFPDYDMVRLRHAPTQDVHFINSGHAPGGLGEPGTPPVAPALTNAIFAATGTRIRELPLARAGFRSV
ncbi:MAG: molybdopterin cofactor-binding domain-containing protein [Pseudomonadota bacterium]